jgi:hypothetical protein
MNEISFEHHNRQTQLLSCYAVGEEVVTKESFISICWRLIPYWLNSWEQVCWLCVPWTGRHFTGHSNREHHASC